MGNRERGTKTTVAFVLIVVILASAFAYDYSVGAGSSGGTTQSSGPLISFSADAYAVETTALLRGFSQATGIAVAPVKSGGSFADANQIAAGAPDDVFVSVALSATGPRYLKNLSANWAIGFATDEMVIAYSNSTSAEAVAAQGNAAAASNATSSWKNFFKSLTSGQFRVGISDPVADPAGLRGWLVLEAAGYLYAAGNQSAFIAPLLKTHANVTGAHAAALVAPLQSGQIQFLFIYRSAAVADHLAFVQLERHVSFGDPSLGGYYSRFSYHDAAGVSVGAPIILCITVPLGSTNSAEALQFVEYVVKNAGTLAAYGLQPYSQAKLYHNVPPPSQISQLIAQGLLAEGGSLQ